MVVFILGCSQQPSHSSVQNENRTEPGLLMMDVNGFWQEAENPQLNMPLRVNTDGIEQTQF